MFRLLRKIQSIHLILAIGAREVEERTVSARRLGENKTETVALDQIIADLAVEATPPDLR